MTAGNNPDPAGDAPKQSLTVSTLWLMAAKGFSFLLGIAFPLFMVRRLDKVELGHYNQIFQLASTICNVLPFGFGITAFYFFPREFARRGAVCLNILLVCSSVGLFASAVFLCCPSVLPLVFRDPALLRYSPAVALLIPLWIVGGLLETFPVVNQEFRLATVFIVGLQLSKAVLMLTATIAFGSVRAIVFAATINASLQTLTVLWYLESRLPGFWRTVDWALLRTQLRYAAPLGLAGMLYAFQGDLHNYFVSRAFGAAAFAVYSVGCVDLPLIGILCESAGSVLLRRVSELQLAGDTTEIIALTARVARKLALVFFPVYAFLMVGGKALITLVYTTRYVESWPIFRINCTVLLLSTILLDPVCRAYPAHMSLFVKVRVGLFLAMGLALWLCVGRFGPAAAITIVVCRTGIENAFSAVYYARVLRATPNDLRQFIPMLRIGAGSLAAGLAALAVRHGIENSAPFVLLLVCGLVFLAVYGVALVVMRIPTAEERDSVARITARYVPFLSRPLGLQ